jgi:hypothetical protein
MAKCPINKILTNGGTGTVNSAIARLQLNQGELGATEALVIHHRHALNQAVPIQALLRLMARLATCFRTQIQNGRSQHVAVTQMQTVGIAIRVIQILAVCQILSVKFVRLM